MMLRTLTRLPSSSFSQDLLTGVPALDDYLQQVDAELAGRASLRRLTLEEVRDHLLEQYTTLAEQGLDPDQAAHQALQGFGSAPELGAEQRRETYRAFYKHIVLFGLPFAVLMSIVMREFNTSWLITAITFVGQFLFYGIFMSLFMTFSAVRQKPATVLETQSEGADTLRVYVPKKSKLIALVMLIFGSAMTLLCVVGILGVGVGQYYGLIGNLVMIYCGVGLIVGMSSAWTRININGNQMEIHTLFGQKRFVIQKVNVFARIPRWQAFWLPAFGRSHRLIVETDSGTTDRFYLTLNGETYNSDKLVAFLEGKKIA